MNMLLLLVSAVILPIMVLAAPSSQRTSDDDTDSSASSETDVIANNAQIQLVNKAKSSDPKERFAAVSRIRGLLSKNSNPDEVAIAQFVSVGVLPVLINCLKSKDDKLLVEAAQAFKSIACCTALAVVKAGAVPLLVKLLQSPNLEVCKFKLLQSPNMELCKEGAWALKNIAAASDDLALAVIETGALPPLVKLLQSPDMNVCNQAALVIGIIIDHFPLLNGIDVEHIQIMVRLDKIKQLKTNESELVLKMIEKIQSSKGCVVCCDKKIQTAFFPCRHACACKECADKISKCPICRQIISDKPRIYLP
uniref:RING-type domain-containing protein n=1 Tax=Globodera pallida TaxID=36090 RepID=A0A183C4J5_GLOPA